MIIVHQEVRWEKLVLLKDFSLIAPTLLTELIFKAIETVISPSVIRETLSETDSGEERTRKLPSGLVVCLVIAIRQPLTFFILNTA
ncbi:MAG: transposase domain-containing protein [Fischerella sp.]|uniref:transposase domain-containing protein n=1 Tax=Fischerella sp. TaxID=1191 RepID=UPI0018469BFD|nr:transposase domain-containing protein [Fischerella sp.]NWF59555.1 transposase domain-containing protein [Fischerella sp.]